MRRLLFIALLSVQIVRAGEQEFAFALPELEGRISLGVFDAKGKLVRTLFAEAEEKDFKTGLNGLITRWDGKDDAGHDVPPGKYQVNGYVVGNDLKAEGVAYHFNDWVEGDDSPAIRRVGAVLPLEGEKFLVYGEAAEAYVWSYEEASGLRAKLGPLPAGSVFLAAGDSSVVVGTAGGERADLYELSDPGLPRQTDTTGMDLSSGTFWKSRLYLKGGEKLTEFEPRTMAPMGLIAIPAAFSGVDANSAALIGWNNSGLWLRRDRAFAVATPAELPEQFSLSAGEGETYWLAGGKGPDLVVRQHAFDGELLRELKLTEEYATGIRVFASKDSLNFFVEIIYHNSRRTVRGYRPKANPAGGEANWEIFLEKSMEDCQSFGWENDRLVAHATEPAKGNAFTVSLPPTTLRSRSETLELKGAGTEEGLWLKTGRGLPLFRLTANPSFQRVVLVAGEKSDTLRLFAGNGAVVAEYLLTGMNHIAPIEAGEIEIPPAKSSP